MLVPSVGLAVSTDLRSCAMVRLVYWVVFSFFNILESFLSIILYW